VKILEKRKLPPLHNISVEEISVPVSQLIVTKHIAFFVCWVGADYYEVANFGRSEEYLEIVKFGWRVSGCLIGIYSRSYGKGKTKSSALRLSRDAKKAPSHRRLNFKVS